MGSIVRNIRGEMRGREDSTSISTTEKKEGRVYNFSDGIESVEATLSLIKRLYSAVAEVKEERFCSVSLIVRCSLSSL
jgi:hypothetical protein